MLREVHGRPQLYIPQAEDDGAPWGLTIGTSFQRAYECEVECYGYAIAIVASRELAALKEEVAEEAPDAKKSTRSF